jgi:hypothetical protein
LNSEVVFGMKWKMIATGRKPTLSKPSRLFRFLQSLGPRDVITSSPPNQTNNPQKPSFNLKAHRITNRRINELEVRKAMAASMMRHQPLF